MSDLVFRAVSHRFDGVDTLHDVDLTVGVGEIVALVGPSGCGKSTLLRIGAGLLCPTGGAVRRCGQDITGRAGQVALMPQRDLLLPWRTVAENVALGLQVRGRPRAAAVAAARRALEDVGLGSVADADPRHLSGGMRQRAAFLRTVLDGRSFVLLDEPFGALDRITRGEIHEWFLSVLADRPVGVLLVTHDTTEAVHLADRVAVMSGVPGTVTARIDVDLPRPRSADDVLAEPVVEIERAVRRALAAPAMSGRPGPHHQPAPQGA